MGKFVVTKNCGRCGGAYTLYFTTPGIDEDVTKEKEAGLKQAKSTLVFGGTYLLDATCPNCGQYDIFNYSTT